MLRISDSVWNEIKNCIPSKKSSLGRPRQDSYTTLCGIFYVISTGIQWKHLSSCYGKPSTVHGWLTKWIKEGVFNDIFHISISKSIEKLGKPECFIIDTSSSKSPFAYFGNINPTDRRKYGIKKSIIIDWNKIILSITLDSANKHDSKLAFIHMNNLKKYIQDGPLVLLADAAFDSKQLSKKFASHNITLHAATNRRRIKDIKIVKPIGRWKIEQIFGMQQWYRSIKFCWCKLKNNYLAFCQFASAIHNFKLSGLFG